jgi:hypothetical protein
MAAQSDPEIHAPPAREELNATFQRVAMSLTEIDRIIREWDASLGNETVLGMQVLAPTGLRVEGNCLALGSLFDAFNADQFQLERLQVVGAV